MACRSRPWWWRWARWRASPCSFGQRPHRSVPGRSGESTTLVSSSSSTVTVTVFVRSWYAPPFAVCVSVAGSSTASASWACGDRDGLGRVPARGGEGQDVVGRPGEGQVGAGVSLDSYRGRRDGHAGTAGPCSSCLLRSPRGHPARSRTSTSEAVSSSSTVTGSSFGDILVVPAVGGVGEGDTVVIGVFVRTGPSGDGLRDIPVGGREREGAAGAHPGQTQVGAGRVHVISTVTVGGGLARSASPCSSYPRRCLLPAPERSQTATPRSPRRRPR